MRVLLAAVPSGLLLAGLVFAEAPGIALREPWDREYAGQAATGEHVLGLWQFGASDPGKDASGRGHDAALNGATIDEEGRFGACLKCSPGWPLEDKPHRALVPDSPALSPRGAFTLEMWLCLSEEKLPERYEPFLLDKKYVAHTDYQFVLGAAGRGGSRVLRSCLGFGEDSSTWYSQPQDFEPGTWYHVAFTYDGQGTGAFYVDGVPAGARTIPGRGAVAGGSHRLSIGDRIGSRYHGFPGRIDQVRIASGVLEFRRAALRNASERSCFVRMEPGAAVRVEVTNLQREPATGAALRMKLDGRIAHRAPVEDLPPGKPVAVAVPIDTRLRPGEYRMTAELAIDKPAPVSTRDAFDITIVPRPPPERMPVVMWGASARTPSEVERLRRIGFTHCLGLSADYRAIFTAGEPRPAADPAAVTANREMLDQALAADLRVAATLSPGAAMRSRDQFRRVGRDGKPYPREDICGLFPELEKHCYHVGASVAQSYNRFPAWNAALIHTEVRGHAAPCFHEHDRAAFKKATGLEIPKEVAGPRGIDYAKLEDFPADRVIPDDHPILTYYRWYWKQGDGWNRLNSALVRGLKSTGRKDLWTWHDPAVRVASVYGSGGQVDYLSQWTYSYPDPIRIGLATDELLCMAGPQPEQQVMKMTQIIWYRGQTAPEPKRTEDALPYRACWEIEQADAPFITIAPMHLREAFWTKIARPIQGIMYHGWQSLVPCEGSSGYRYTHPQTQHELARLVREVVAPLGPMLRRVPGVRSDVAMLESFSSEMFARRGTYGWNGSWAGDCWHILQWAHLQPDIVFDETIAERGLEGYRVLVMPDCDVLTRTVVDRVKAFQADGGLVIGDERLCPAIKPDVVLPVFQRTGRNAEDKAAMQKIAADLRKQLDGRYARYVDTSSPEVIPYRRAFKHTDYVFVVNDRREYGDYVGQHAIVMENGLPSDATVTVRRKPGVVYDVLAHREVPVRKQDGAVAWDVHLGPCGGRVFLVTPRPIAAVKVTVPETIARGESGACRIAVVDGPGEPLEAVVPLAVSIRDPEGREAELSGAHAAVDGRLEVTLDIAPNDVEGLWHVEVQELASGRSAAAYFRVPRPGPWPPQRGAVPKEAAKAEQPKG